MFKYLSNLAEMDDKGLRLIHSEGEEFISYRALFISAVQIGQMIRPYLSGDFTILFFENQRNYFEYFWGLLSVDAYPLIFSYHQTNFLVFEKIAAFIENNYPFSMIVSKKLADQLLSRFENHFIQRAIAFTDLFIFQYQPSCPKKKREIKELVFYQSTSGTTGVPKLVPECMTPILSHIENASYVNEFRAEDVILNWLPLEHVVPILSFHLRGVVLHNQQIFVDTHLILSAPEKWLIFIERYRVTHTWAPNFAYKLLVSAIEKGMVDEKSLNLSSIRSFMNAGEPIDAKTSEKFVEFLKRHHLGLSVYHPAYGMAELSTCVTYLRSCDDDRNFVNEDKTLASCGRFIPDCEGRIINVNGKILNEKEVGCLQVRGKVVFPGYQYQEERKKTQWFETGDLGRMIAGELYVVGRAKESFSFNGVLYYYSQIESTILSLLSFIYDPWFGISHIDDEENKGRVLAALCVDAQQVEKAIHLVKEKCLSLYGFVPYIFPFSRSEFPKTSSGKIRRGELKKALLSKFHQANHSQLEWAKLEWTPCLDCSWERRALKSTIFFVSKADCFKRVERFFPRENIILIEEGILTAGIIKQIKEIDSISTAFFILDHSDQDKVDQYLDGKTETLEIDRLVTFQLLEALSDRVGTAVLCWELDGGEYSFSLFVKAFRSRFKNKVCTLVFDKLDRFIKPDVFTVLLGFENFPNELKCINEKFFVRELFSISSEHKRSEWRETIERGWCLVTGGMSGVGCLLLPMIAQKLNVNLFVTGRRKKKSFSKQQKEIIAQIEKNGFKFHYFSADLLSDEAIDDLVYRISKITAAPLSVIHMAGQVTYNPRAQWENEERELVQLKSRSLVKLCNHWVDNHQLEFVVTISTTFSEITPWGFEGYAYGNLLANRLIENWAESENIFSMTILFPIIRNVGMNAGGSEKIFKDLGLPTIEAIDLVKIFEKAMSLKSAGVIALSDFSFNANASVGVEGDKKSLSAVIKELLMAISSRKNIPNSEPLLNFFQTSLDVIRFCLLCHQRTGKQIKPSVIFEGKSVGELFAILETEK